MKCPSLNFSRVQRTPTSKPIDAHDVFSKRQAVTRQVAHLGGEEHVQRLVPILATVPVVAATSDIWTSNYANLSYLTITLHFWPKDAKELAYYNLRTLAFKSSERHTNNIIERDARKACEEVELALPKVFMVTGEL